MIMVEYDRSLPSRSGHAQQQQPQQSQQPQQQPQQQQSQQQPQLQGREPTQYEQIEHQSAPATPSPPYQYAPMQPFSHQHPQHSVRSTPTSYPSPASFPSPSMTAYASYPASSMPQGHNSPNVPAMNVSGYSLPPIRMTPPNSSLPPAGMQLSGSSSMPAPPPGAMFYPPQPAYNLSLQSSISAPQLPQPPSRYTHTPGAPERIMSGGRHKKEIKRRTKTGCLTCRKRRIKCDEAHPSCKNCAKSKRECLGYDPIFKSQTGPPPILPPVQPGPVPTSSMPMHLNGMAYGHPHPPPPPPPQMALSQPTYAYGQSLSTAENSPASSCEPYEFNVIDPALESTPIPVVQPLNNQLGMPGMTPDCSLGPRMELKRGYDRTSPFPSTDSARLSAAPSVRSGSPSSTIFKDGLISSSAKRIKIDDLLGKSEDRGGSPLTPPSGDSAGQQLSLEDVIYIYRTRYAPLLDALVETGWFKTKGVERIMRNDQFLDSFAAILTRINNRSGTYVQEDVSVPPFSGDAGILMDSVRTLWGTRASSSVAPTFPLDCENDYTNNIDLINRDLTIRRLFIIEALLSSPQIEGVKVATLGSDGSATLSGQNEKDDKEKKFWDALERFVSLPFRIENIMPAQKCLEEISHSTLDVRFRELLFRIAEAKFFKYRLEGTGEHYQDQDNTSSYNSIFLKAADYVNAAVNIPTDVNATDTDLVAQRIAGRALGLWEHPQNSTHLVIF